MGPARFAVTALCVIAGVALSVYSAANYHVALARIFDLDGIDQLGNQLVHTVVPLLAVLGWLIFGPRGLTSRLVAWLSLLFPACWMAFTLIRGAVIHWDPYPFIDVSVIGYGKAILTAFWVALLLLGLAAGATALDARLGPRGRSGDLARAGAGHRGDLAG